MLAITSLLWLFSDKPLQKRDFYAIVGFRVVSATGACLLSVWRLLQTSPCYQHFMLSECVMILHMSAIRMKP